MTLPRWPAPALLAWGGGWALYAIGVAAGMHAIAAMLLACALGMAFGLAMADGFRRALIMCGFPLSVAVCGVVELPGWAWLLPLALCLLVYPIYAWRDAPVFPTPAGALHGLALHAPLGEGARLLDAGCGLGDGLRALRLAYGDKTLRLEGVEWSWPLRMLCAMRCPWALVRQGDIWREDWSGYAMVYLFQRPESMARAADKALAQLPPGSWLVSLEFEAQTLLPDATLQTLDGRPLWLYRAPFHASRRKLKNPDLPRR